MRTVDVVVTLLRTAWRAEPAPAALAPGELDGALPALRRGGVAGLAWNRIRRTALAGTDAGAALQHDFRRQALQRAVHAGVIRDALGRLGSGLPSPLLAKGWAASRLYPTPGFRPCGDVDLYVEAASYAPALAALARAGPPIAVDLHRGFADLDDRDPAEVRARARLVVEGGLRVLVPGPEDHLRLLSLHMLRHGAARPLWLCDVAAALEQRPSGFDWDWFAAGSPRRTEAALAGLCLAGELLGARLAGAPRVPVPGWMSAAVLRAWEAGTHRRDRFLSQVRREPLRALREHWPNAIEATLAVGGRFHGAPRLAYQAQWAAARGLRRARLGFSRAASSLSRAGLPDT